MGPVTSYGVGQYAPSASNEGHAFVTDRFYKANGTVRGCIYLLGAKSVAKTDLAPATTSAPLKAGLAVLSADCGSTTSTYTFGNSTSVSRMADAYTFLTGTLGAKTGKIGLVGVSGGALTCLAWAVQNPAKVAWMYLAIPAIDVQDIHDNRSAGLLTVGLTPTDIETAYGGQAAYNAAMPAQNPASSLSALAGIPMRVLYSGDDPICDVSTVNALAASVGSSGTFVNTGNNGHSTGGLNDLASAIPFISANS
jgi:predicted alpha/beta hydrolase family esterase